MFPIYLSYYISFFGVLPYSIHVFTHHAFYYSFPLIYFFQSLSFIILQMLTFPVFLSHPVLSTKTVTLPVLQPLRHTSLLYIFYCTVYNKLSIFSSQLNVYFFFSFFFFTSRKDSPQSIIQFHLFLSSASSSVLPAIPYSPHHIHILLFGFPLFFFLCSSI